MSSNKFGHLVGEAPDPIVQTMMQYAKDTNPKKLDVSIGVYSDEKGSFYTFPCVTKAKEVLNKQNAGHNYTTMQGLPEFVSGAKRVAFGEKRASEGKLASIQTISGTGALRMAVIFLVGSGYKDFYVGTPTWGNYFGIVEHAGGKAHTFQHFNPSTGEVDFPAIVEALKQAPPKSVFMLQVGCHNPTGADYTEEQWKEIGALLRDRDLIPLLDCAYLGFSSGSTENDAWPIRHLYDLGIDFLVCQSFSKNLGLYGERVGAMHVVVQDDTSRANVLSNVVSNFRQECSFAPAFGARVASIVFEQFANQWADDVMFVTKRLKDMRQKLYSKLVAKGTPGNWETAIKQNGLFWHSGLTPEQNQRLIGEFHVYSTGSGRVNIAGLNDDNIDHFVDAIDHIVRSS